MVFSEYILKIPYSVIWYMRRLFRSKREVIFYCDNILDYLYFKNDLKYLPEVKVVAKNKKVQFELNRYNVISTLYPAFPDVLITARHPLHKFPVKLIYKIGVRHGVYHFKNFIATEKFNRFDAYFMSSKYEVEEAKHLGIRNVYSCSTPKSDDFFDDEKINEFKEFRKQFDDREIILFSATWDKSGLGAVEKWYDKLDLLSGKFNIIVTLHPWISQEYKEKVKSNKNIHFIEDNDLNKYLYISDYLVSDTSSIIGEFACLQKPIITFKIPVQGRLIQNVVDMLEEMSYRVDDFEEIEGVIGLIQANGDVKAPIYEKYLNILYDLPFGNNGKKRAEMIRKLIEENT